MRFVRNLTLLAAALTLSIGGYADAASDARKAIQANYDSDNAAAKRRDAAGFLSHTSADFVSIAKNGKKQTLAETKRDLPGFFKATKELNAVSQIRSIQVKGSIANVTVFEAVTIKL